jgi:hypothetical protein
MPLQESDLERRVLAHEQILEMLIAHMSETEPKFLARLREEFSSPPRAHVSEPGGMDAGAYAYANQFIQSATRLCDKALSKRR